MTPSTTRRVTIDGPAGPLEVVHNVPEAPYAGIALVAHPNPVQGGTLDNKVVQTLAKVFDEPHGLRAPYPHLRIDQRAHLNADQTEQRNRSHDERHERLY